MVFESHDCKTYEFIWFPELVKFARCSLMLRMLPDAQDVQEDSGPLWKSPPHLPG